MRRGVLGMRRGEPDRRPARVYGVRGEGRDAAGRVGPAGVVLDGDARAFER